MIDRLISSAGRPVEHAADLLGDKVIGTADALFIEKGYAATSMATVASRSRVGKQTLYRRYPDKAALFREVVRRRIEGMTYAVKEARILDPSSELKALGRAALTSALDPDFITLNRIAIAESAMFPELAFSVAECWRTNFADRCMESIKRAQDVGLLKLGDPQTIANIFLWGLVGGPFYHALMRGHLLKGDTGRDDYLETAWRLFLDGLGTNLTYS
jgi:TetR/AcrR family transcriptional regulator, regulator of autoinduction and epiphytic fitness